MSNRTRRMALVFVLGLTPVFAFASPSSAQTVIVRNAPAGGDVEVQLNAAPPRTATADAAGQAAVSLELPAGTTEGVVTIVVDACGRQILVHLVSPGAPLEPPGANCTRSDAGAQFVIRPVTTFVLDVGGSNVSVRSRQGPAFASWLLDPEEAAAAGLVVGRQPRAGLMLFGGGGFASLRNAVQVACGQTTCTGSGVRLGFEGGATFWATPYVGAQAAFLKPQSVKTTGSGQTFSFDSALDTRLFVLAANVGGRTNNVRLYGQAGANYHHSTFTQTETIGSVTQTLVLETKGWGWLFGGGLEGWVNRVLSIYAEGQYAAVRGDDVNGGEGRMDDHLILITGGVRLRLGF